MIAGPVAAVVLLVAAVRVARGRPSARRRLARLGDRGAGRSGAAGATGGRVVRWGWRVAPWGVGLAVLVMVGGWWGAVLGVAAGVAVAVAVRRIPAARAARERQEAAAELPYGADLLAAVLRAGAPVDRALSTVGAALGGPLGRRFDEVGRALRLGAHGSAGWRALADVPGAEALIPAAVRAAESGATLAAACGRVAAQRREQQAADLDAAGARAGVLVVVPLGCCFLPAFVLITVVPVLIGALDDLLV